MSFKPANHKSISFSQNNHVVKNQLNNITKFSQTGLPEVKNREFNKSNKQLHSTKINFSNFKEKQSRKSTAVSSSDVKSEFNYEVELNIIEKKEKNMIKSISFVEFLSSKLTEIISESEKNDEELVNKIKIQKTSVFYSKVIPEITIRNFLIRIVKLCKPELSTCIIASIYIDRFCETLEFVLTLNNIHR